MQSEKDSLKRMGYDVCTVHEFQGNQAEIIYLVRLNNRVQEPLFNKVPYQLVALTRHTKQLIYFSVIKDQICEKINFKFTENELSSHRKGLSAGSLVIPTFQYDMGNYHPYIKYVSDDIFDSVNIAHCISADFRLSKGFALNLVSKFPEIKFFRGSRFGQNIIVTEVREKKIINLITKAKYYLKPTYLSLERSLRSLREYLTINNEKEIHCPKLGCGLDGLNWTVVFSILHKVFLNSGIIIFIHTISRSFDELYEKSTQIMLNNGYVGQPPILYKKIFKVVDNEKKITFDNNVLAVVSEVDIQALQGFYDICLPGHSIDFDEHDHYMVRHTDNQLRLENCSFPMVNFYSHSEKKI